MRMIEVLMSQEDVPWLITMRESLFPVSRCARDFLVLLLEGARPDRTTDNLEGPPPQVPSLHVISQVELPPGCAKGGGTDCGCPAGPLICETFHYHRNCIVVYFRAQCHLSVTRGLSFIRNPLYYLGHMSS